MPDYRELYKDMFWAAEKAVKILIDAQRQCEEKHILTETELLVFPKTNNPNEDNNEDP